MCATLVLGGTQVGAGDVTKIWGQLSRVQWGDTNIHRDTVRPRSEKGGRALLEESWRRLLAGNSGQHGLILSFTQAEKPSTMCKACGWEGAWTRGTQLEGRAMLRQEGPHARMEGLNLVWRAGVRRSPIFSASSPFCTNPLLSKLIGVFSLFTIAITKYLRLSNL